MDAKPQLLHEQEVSSSLAQSDELTNNGVKVNVTMEEKLRRWKQSKQDASQSEKSSFSGGGRRDAANNSRPGGSKRKLIESASIHRLSIPKASYRQSRASTASPVASTRLAANGKPRRLSQSDNCCKNSQPVQVNCTTARSNQYPAVIGDDNDVIPTIASQDLPKVVEKKIILASEPDDRETPIVTNQLSLKTSGVLGSKPQEDCKDDWTELDLDQPQKHPSVLVLSQKDTVSATRKSAKFKEKWGGNPVLDKENQVKLSVLPTHVLSEPMTSVEKERELLAKTLIKVAIGFEKRRRMATAFSIFKRAYCILPKKSAKLVERLQRLADEWPEIVVQAPSQEMPTATYMTKVLERDLMDVLNHGSTKELTELFAIGHKRAELVIDERPFDQIIDLERVLGISTKAVAKLYEHHTNWENHQW